jgi:tetratricopeptide (TPR) repeat protein
MDAGNYKEAADLLEAFVKERPDSDAALQTLGEAYSELQEYGKAAEAYRKASELDPEDLEIKKAQAQALFLSDKIDEAAQLYQELSKAEPDDGLALLRLGQIYRRQMKYDLARQNLLKSAQAFPDSVEVQFNLVMLDRDEGKLKMRWGQGDSQRPKSRTDDIANQQNRRIF